MKKTRIKMMILFTVLILVAQISVLHPMSLSLQLLATNMVFGTVSVISTEREYDDITDIKIDVYSLQLLSKRDYGDEYGHYYELSVYPDENGKFSFSKPANQCAVAIDLNSIKDGFGANESSIIINEYDTNVNLTVSEITDFDISIDNTSISFSDSSNNILYTSDDYSISFDTFKSNENLSKSSMLAYCDFDNISIEKSIDFRDMHQIEKVDFLHSNNLISDEDKVVSYCNILNDDYVLLTECDLSSIFSEIAAYEETAELSEETISLLSQTRSSYIPDYNDEEIYTKGFFSIHYEAGTLSTEQIRRVYTTLNYTKATFCHTYRFEEPNLKSGHSTYDVYISYVPDASYSGLNVQYIADNQRVSDIVLNLKKRGTDGYYTISDYSYGSLAHEFMHAIQFTYRSYSGTSVYFNEAVANLAKVTISENPGISKYVNAFLDSPEYELFYNAPNTAYTNRAYGAVLFPMYITQHVSDMTAILEIYEDFATSSGDIYTSIDNVLADYCGSSLAEAYLGCMEANYNVSSNYSNTETDWQNTTKKTPFTTTSQTYNMPRLSTRYFEKVAPINGNNTCNFTFGLHSGTSADNVSLKSIYTSPTGDTTTTQRTFSDGVRAVTINLNSNAKVCFLMSNIAVNASSLFYTYITIT